MTTEVKPVGEFTKEDAVEAMNFVRNRRGLDPVPQRGTSTERVIHKAEKHERRRVKETKPEVMIRRKKQKPKKPSYRPGIGAYVKQLLCEVISTNAEGFPVGHGYNVIVDKVRERFPDSKCDDKHVRWYCTKLREKGTQPPVYRERGKWT